MLQSAKNAIGADKRRDGPCLRARSHDNEMEFPFEGQGGATGFAPKAFLDRGCNIAFEYAPKWSCIVELARVVGGRIPDPVIVVIGVDGKRNRGHARRWDRLMENWQIVSAMHEEQPVDSFSALAIVFTFKCAENGNC